MLMLPQAAVARRSSWCRAAPRGRARRSTPTASRRCRRRPRRSAPSLCPRTTVTRASWVRRPPAMPPPSPVRRVRTARPSFSTAGRAQPLPDADAAPGGDGARPDRGRRGGRRLASADLGLALLEPWGVPRIAARRTPLAPCVVVRDHRGRTGRVPSPVASLRWLRSAATARAYAAGGTAARSRVRHQENGSYLRRDGSTPFSWSGQFGETLEGGASGRGTNITHGGGLEGGGRKRAGH